MTRLEISELTDPLTSRDPCGPDLDAADDDDFMNILVTAETVLPSDYIVADNLGNRRPFDENKTLDLDALLSSAMPMVERTRDLRLMLLLTKLSVLRKDLWDVRTCVEAIAILLERFWDGVHPRSDNGDIGIRRDVLQRLDDPSIVNTLQHVTLFATKGLGVTTYHAYSLELALKSESPGSLERSAVDAVLLDEKRIDLPTLLLARDALVPAYEVISGLHGALARVQRVCTEQMRTRGPTIEALPRVVGGISGFIDRVRGLVEAAIHKLDPSLAPLAGSEAVSADTDGGTEALTGDAADLPRSVSRPSAFSNAAAASEALAAATRYFHQFEPSNPALLLLRQAQALVGKSFLEAMQSLVPDHMPKATVNVGSGLLFTLPLARLAEAGPTPIAPSGGSGPQESEDQRLNAASRIEPARITSREQAVGVLEKVGAFYRSAEPSSPIPLLTDRARGLTGKDFLALLGDLLPKDTLASGKSAKS